MYRTFPDYFFNPWNYQDLIPLCTAIIPIIVTIHDLNETLASDEEIDPEAGIVREHDLIVICQSATAILQWLKFLYFLRVFESTGYLVRVVF